MPDWLLRAEIKLFVTSFVLATFVVGGWFLARRWRSSGAVLISDESGRTVSSPRIVILSCLCAALAVGAFLIGLFDGVDESAPDNRLAWILVVAGFAIAALYTALVATHRWEWNRDGLAWHGAWQSRQLRWPQIKRFGRNWAGYFFVSTETAGTIRWSEYTHEFQALNQAVLKYRPDLFEGPSRSSAKPDSGPWLW